jgi:L-ribulose-5-phosphate 3-epimerase
MQRRTFLRHLAGAAAASLAVPSLAFRRPEGTWLKKAVHLNMIEVDGSVLEKLELVKALGFDGVELDGPSDLDRDEVVDALRKTGLAAASVIDSVHWDKTLGDPDAAVREAGLEGLRAALRDAKAYGATSVLLVPAVVNREISYADAYQRSQAEIRKALPLARELGVKIAVENVWNQFLLSPLEFARYIDELDDPIVGAHFDIGNIVNYGWPEQWIRTLGPRILRLHIKEYSRKKRNDEGLWKGFEVELGEGDVEWPAVTAALREIGYDGWAIAEIPGGGEPRLRDIAARMDRILEG